MQPEYLLPSSQKPDICSYIDQTNSAPLFYLFEFQF
jgi:hypothetical protein